MCLHILVETLATRLCTQVPDQLATRTQRPNPWTRQQSPNQDWSGPLAQTVKTVMTVLTNANGHFELDLIQVTK